MSAINGLADLRPGDIGFGPLAGGWGSLAMWGEVVADGGFHVGELNVGHVFEVVSTWTGPTGTPIVEVVEAMPGGARRVTIGPERWGPHYAYCRPAEDYPGQGLDAAAIACLMVGIPYSPASYAALAAWRFGLHTPRLEAWINRRQPPVPVEWPSGRQDTGIGHLGVALPREAICSVLVDQAWTLTGKSMVHGVAHQCVTPSTLATSLLAMPGAIWGGPAFGSS